MDIQITKYQHHLGTDVDLSGQTQSGLKKQNPKNTKSNIYLTHTTVSDKISNTHQI